MKAYIEYLSYCVKWAFQHYEWTERLTTLIVSFVIVLGIGGASLALWLKNESWLYAVIPFGILVLVVLFVAPFYVWWNERIIIDKYEAYTLELYYEDNDQFIHERGNNWVFRIGIRTTSKLSINNVEVKLIRIDNNRNAYSDAPLRPAYCLPGEPSGFILKPGESKFVEIASWGVADHEIQIHYYNNYQLISRGIATELIRPFLLYSSIPKGRHRITLQATGENTCSVTETFTISTIGDVPTWGKNN